MHKTNKMKKIIFASALSVFSLFSTTITHAQDIAGTAYAYPKSNRVVDPATNKSSRILRDREVNVLAARDFNKNFQNAQDVKWVDGKNGLSVYFKLDGFNMRSTYDKKGKEEYTLKYYDETKMSPSLRHLVKSTYYDYKIVLVTEITRNSNLSFVVKMEGEKEYLTLKIFDGDIIEYEKISKI